MTPELALAQAREAEARYRRGARAGPLPPLLGVAVSIKDLFDVEGVRTTLGSRLSGAGPAGADSAVVARLRRAGAVFLGKTNTAEFGQSATTENRLGLGGANPWDPQRTAGGSSGGAAASVAAGLATAALGSDGGGSIRIPAAMCGLFGLKPTINSVPEDGPFRAMTDFSCPGAIVRRVADARRFLHAILNHDMGTRDLTARFRIGWCAVPADRPIDPAVQAVTDSACSLLGELGHEVEPISLSFDGWMDAFGPLVLADEWRLRRHLLDKHASELTDYARRAITAGGRVTPDDLQTARARKDEFRRRLKSVFDDHHLIVTPSTACVAFPIGTRPREIAGRPVDPLWGARSPSPLRSTSRVHRRLRCRSASPTGCPLASRSSGRGIPSARCSMPASNSRRQPASRPARCRGVTRCPLRQLSSPAPKVHVNHDGAQAPVVRQWRAAASGDAADGDPTVGASAEATPAQDPKPTATTPRRRRRIAATSGGSIPSRR